MIPENATSDECKRAVLEHVVVCRPAGCNHIIVLKAEWLSHPIPGVDLDDVLICPDCHRKADPDLLYIKEEGLKLIQSRGVEAHDIKSWRDIFGDLVHGIVFHYRR